jgi:aspartyl/glutamyl-tRNA(Asn/Gln) amidotransferase C subunit
VKNLRTEEAALTGESVPADKFVAEVAANATVGDRESMAFSGTMVVSGRATGVVVWDVEVSNQHDKPVAVYNILTLVEQLQAVDTAGVEPMANPLGAVQRLRADNVTEANQREAFQTLAPAVENGLYLVPKVIE